MFIWCLPEAGHHVVSEWGLGEAQHLSGDESRRIDYPWVRPIESSGKESWRRYAPLESNPALFRRFVDVGQSQESIVDFADRFGLLTDPEKGEPLATWRAAITDMRLAVECWETAQEAGALPLPGSRDVDIRCEVAEGNTDKTATLADAKYSPVSPGAATAVNTAADVDLLAQPSQEPGRRVFVSHGISNRRDFLEFLASEINRNICHARPVFLPTFLPTGFDVSVDRVRVERLSLQLMPTTPLEAMWLQFG